MLGTFSASVDGQPIPESAWTRKKAKTLIKILALEPSHFLDRDRALELLWPEQETEQALNNFHKTVHAARRALEPDLKAGTASRYLLALDQRLVLQAPGQLWIDSEEFARAAKRALADAGPSGLAAAIQLYTGELLKEDRREDWATLQREQISSLHQHLLLRLASHHVSVKQPARAIDLLQQAVQAQPTNESAHRQLMQLYAAAGNRHSAVTQFRICAEALKKDLDAEPEKSTVRLFEEIQRGQHEAAPEAEVPVSASRPVSPPPAPVPPPLDAPSRPAPRRSWLLGAGATALAAGVWWASRFPATATSRVIRSLAVVPFKTQAQPLEYVSSGLTESLISNLSRLPSLRVMARSTVYAFRDKEGDPRAMGKAMGVAAVLAGSVAGTDHLQVDLELVDAQDGARLWGNQYSFPARQLPAMEVRMVNDVTSALNLGDQLPQRSSRGRTGNPLAYAEYLQGRFQWNKRTENGFREAIKHFEAAIAIDPHYALAYAGLADCYGLLGFSDARPAESFPMARRMAEKALAFDDEMAEAHTSLAMVNALYDWNWPKAETEFRRAIQLNPGFATAHHWYAVHLNGQGRPREAQQEFAIALSLDPLSRIITSNSGYVPHYQHDYASAIVFYRKALELDPAFLVARQGLMLAFEQSGQFPLAAIQGAEILKLEGQPDLAARFATLARSSYPAALAAWRSHTLARAQKEYVSPVTLAGFAIRTGDHQDAFLWLERALAERAAPLVYLKVNTLYDPLRSDPRFSSLLRKIGL